VGDFGGWAFEPFVVAARQLVSNYGLTCHEGDPRQGVDWRLMTSVKTG